MERSRHLEQGMTILEILIATMLLAVVAVIIFSAFGIGLRAAALANGMSTATGLAEETLATLTASPCGSSFRLPVRPEPEREGLSRYRREANVRPAPGKNMWELSVTVYWKQERAERSVTLTTLRYISEACAFVGQ
ncbi:MAG: type IV pilus modification PilV family protein [Armatimonadota bacterium]